MVRAGRKRCVGVLGVLALACVAGTVTAGPAPGGPGPAAAALPHCPEAARLRQQMLTAINAARAQGAHCGPEEAPPVGPLNWNERLAQAADDYAHTLAELDKVSHDAVRGESLPQRLQRAGYRYSMAGENLAAGQADIPEAVSAWLASPTHCRNVMKPHFLEIGLSCATREGTRYGTYWVAHFGTEFLD